MTTTKLDSTLVVEVDGPVGHITLGRPGTIHVLDEAFGHRLDDAVAVLAADEGVRAVVLSSRARAFCAGLSFEVIPSLADPMVAARLLASLNKGVLALASLQKPTVAAVGGAAVGGGHNLALACDVLIAASDAIFCQVFGNIGLATDLGSLHLLSQRVGPHRAKELAITARELSAEEALKLGAVDEVVPKTQLATRAVERAAELAARSPLAIAAMKRGFMKTEGLDLAQSLKLEAELQMPQYASQDFQDATAAFLEKRAPKFQGR